MGQKAKDKHTDATIALYYCSLASLNFSNFDKTGFQIVLYLNQSSLSVISQYYIFTVIFVRLGSTTRRHFHSALLLLTEKSHFKVSTRASPPGPVNSLYLSVCVDIVWGAWTSGTSSCWLFLGPNPPLFVQYPDVRYLYDTFSFLGFVIFAVYFFLKMCFFCFVLSSGRIKCGPLRHRLKAKHRSCLQIVQKYNFLSLPFLFHHFFPVKAFKLL